ncbi:MAG: alpha/beta hydrolase [Syntrophomonadaceae bacterium]|nr:alpha/beta hydrolase [Syntrophomonadaceae bacterium]
MQRIEIDDHIIAYKSQSAIQPKGSLLFIHGSGGDHHKWDAQMSELPPDFTGLAIDLPGHGVCPGPVLQSVDAAAALVSKIPSLLNLPRPVFLVGHSMGAAIAMSIALDYGEYIDGLILIGAGSRLRVLPAMLEALRAGQKDAAFLKVCFAPDAPKSIVDAEILSFQQVAADVLYSDFNACDHFDRGKDIIRINIPTLLIVGKFDQLTPVKYAQFLHDHISVSELVIIPQAGHYVMFEKATETNQAITEFITNLHDEN